MPRSRLFLPIALIAAGIVTLVAYSETIRALFALCLGDQRYTYILVVPLIGAGFLYRERKTIFGQMEGRPLWALVLLISSFVLWFTGSSQPGVDPILAASPVVASMLLLWFAVIVGFFGLRPLVAAPFPFFVLFLAVPFPPAWMDLAEAGLQKGSAEITYGIFKLTGTPVYRDGVHFTLPGAVIEVAEECSGIRAATILLVTTTALSHLFLRSAWTKILFVAVTIPISILKNAIRISIISWLGVYVSPDHFYGSLHRNGGPLFSALALAMLVPILLILQRSELLRGSRSRSLTCD